MSIPTENTFETDLVQSLIEQGGYTGGNIPDYSPDLCMFKFEVIKFLRNHNPSVVKNVLDVYK
ncbi:MAG TPA: hypothetical protein VK982_09665 [Bacteroidales bacterium]|nr:hypothetical protein [Bacteroidales bacterium]